MQNKFLILSLILITSTTTYICGETSWFNWFWENDLVYTSDEYDDYDDTFTGTEFSWNQTKKYILARLSSFKKAAKQYIPKRLLQKLEDNTLQAIKATSTGPSYKKDIIEQFILGAMIDFIEQVSFDYAMKKLDNRVAATKIADSMRNNAMAKISKNPQLDLKEVAPFVGSSLRQAVKNYLTQ